jgi:hypothetical protein
MERANEIAAFVGAQYHLVERSPARARRRVGSPTAGNDPIRAFAIAKKPNVTSQSDFDFVDPTSTLMFSLCGAGKKCSIKEGKPSVARGAVLRREALELALYTFRYVDGVDAIIAFLPPKPDSPPYAVFFKRDDLDSQLDHPLVRTSPAEAAAARQTHAGRAQDGRRPDPNAVLPLLGSSTPTGRAGRPPAGGCVAARKFRTYTALTPAVATSRAQYTEGGKR